MKNIVDNLASLHAWILKRDDKSWLEKFQVMDSVVDLMEQMQTASMKSISSLDTDYFTDDLINRVSRTGSAKTQMTHLCADVMDVQAGLHKVRVQQS